MSTNETKKKRNLKPQEMYKEKRKILIIKKT